MRKFEYVISYEDPTMTIKTFDAISAEGHILLKGAPAYLAVKLVQRFPDACIGPCSDGEPEKWALVNHDDRVIHRGMTFEDAVTEEEHADGNYRMVLERDVREKPTLADLIGQYVELTVDFGLGCITVVGKVEKGCGMAHGYQIVWVGQLCVAGGPIESTDEDDKSEIAMHMIHTRFLEL